MSCLYKKEAERQGYVKEVLESWLECELPELTVRRKYTKRGQQSETDGTAIVGLKVSSCCQWVLLMHGRDCWDFLWH